MPKTTKVITVHTERASYSDAVKALQEKIEVTTQEIYSAENQRIVGLTSTSATKNNSSYPSYALTAFILVEIDTALSDMD